MSSRMAVLAATAFGGATVGGAIGGLLGLAGDMPLDLGAVGGGFGLLAGALVGIVAVGIGHAGAPGRIALREGDLVCGWRVVRQIAAAGPTGPVHLVRRQGQWGVMKSIHRDDAVLGLRASVLLQETDAARAVTSRYVARLVDGGEVGDRCFVVYQYAGDIDLERAIVTGRRPSGGGRDEAKLWRLALTTLIGLEDVHDHQLVHQDLTPANICDRDDFGVILDLGMARVDNALLTTSARKRLALEYAPPERQRAGYRARSSADIYQWAACMLTAATGRRPYGDAQEDALVRAIAAGPPDTADVPGWLRPLLDDALRADPGRRPTAGGLLGRLMAVGTARGWATVRPTSARPPQPWPRRPAPEVAAGAIAAASVAVILLAFSVLTSGAGSDDGTAGPSVDETTTTQGDDAGPSSGSSTTSPESSTTSTTTTSTTTTTAPPAPIATWTGLWFGPAAGADGEVSVAFLLDQPEAREGGAPAGTWFAGTCSGPLRLVSATEATVALTPVEPDPGECGFGGEARLTRSGGSASYDWSNGGSTRTGTFALSTSIPATPNPGWPTDTNEADPAFYAGLGVCAAGGDGCSESGQYPDWTSCVDDLCIAGGGASVVDVHRGIDWLLEIPESTPHTGGALLGLGFTEAQTVDLLGL